MNGAVQPQTRAQADPNYQWDLTPLFRNQEEWEAALNKAKEAADTIPALKGTLDVPPAQLAQKLKSIFQAQQQAELVSVYAFLLLSGDNGDSCYQAMNDRATKLLVALESASSFLIPELLALPQQRFAQLTKAPELAPYAQVLRDVARRREHTLSAEQEKLIAMLGEVAQGPDRSFSMLTEVDMRFPSIRDEQGSEVELTHGNFGVYRESSDRRVRREAFEKYFGRFVEYKNTLAAIYANSVKLDDYFAQAKGFSSAVEASLFQNDVPVSVYESLIAAVHEKLDAMEAYLKLRKETLGVEELHLYDLYCPMVADVEYSCTYEQAQQMVLRALAPLGEDYLAVVRRAFQERWIDVYENRGKTTGAYSCGVYGAHPYILLNFQGRLDDVFTLAHEMGHTMHSYFSDRTQPYHDHDYSLLVAEVASTVNEVLLLRCLLAEEKEPSRRAYLLNHFLEGFRTTLYRQTLFAEFELTAHKMEREGEALNAESLSKVYAQLNRTYYKGAEADEWDSIEWARIPHFYRAYYVYQYATGYSSAVAIADGILSTGNADAYLRFLTMGGSKYPLEELKAAGVDLTTPQPVKAALNVFANTVRELEALLKEMK